MTVRNKKRVGYTYELTLKFKGKWAVIVSICFPSLLTIYVLNYANGIRGMVDQRRKEDGQGPY